MMSLMNTGESRFSVGHNGVLRLSQWTLYLRISHINHINIIKDTVNCDHSLIHNLCFNYNFFSNIRCLDKGSRVFSNRF